MRSSFSSGWLLVPLLCGALLPGCTQSDSTGTSGKSDAQPSHAAGNTAVPVKTANTVCPLMGGDVTSDGGTTEWNGKLIGFCCPECVPEWEKLSEEEKSKKLDVAQSDAGSAPSK